MLAPWLLYASWLGALLGIIAVLAERMARWRKRPARWIWLAAIVAMVVIPVALSLRPHPGLPGVSRPDHGINAAPFDRLPPLVEFLDTPLLILWLLGSTLLAARIAGTTLALTRRRSRWAPARLDGHAVLVAEQLGPVVIGWRRFTTVIPRWALTFDASSRALILQHEAEHARCGDPYLRSAALVALLLMPWNPAVWWATRRLRLAIEIDCDQRVLSRGVNPHDYASLLLAVGARMSALPFAWATALVGSRSSLERRIVAMTTSHPPRSRRWPIIAVSAGIALTAALACEAPVPDPIAPSTALQADTGSAGFLTLADPNAALIVQGKRDTSLTYFVPDCQTGVSCEANPVLRLGLIVPDKTGETDDDVAGQDPVTARSSGQLYIVQDRPGSDERIVPGTRLVPDSSR